MFFEGNRIYGENNSERVSDKEWKFLFSMKNTNEKIMEGSKWVSFRINCKEFLYLYYIISRSKFDTS